MRFLAFLAPLFFVTPGFAGEWELDPVHSSVGFSVRHMMVATVHGQFDNVSAVVNINEENLSKSTVEVTIDTNSINTRIAKRDAHLKSPDFFDVEKFPTMTFKSTKIEKAFGGKFKVVGDLTMHGVTHPVTLHVSSLTAPVKNPMGKMVRGVSATGELNRKEWGLGWNKVLEAGGMMVGEMISLQIDAELAAKAAPTTPSAVN